MSRFCVALCVVLGVGLGAPVFAQSKDDKALAEQGLQHLKTAGIDAPALRAAAFKTDGDFARFVNGLVPVQAAQLKEIDEAIDAFARIGDEKLRKSELELAQASKIALLIARASSDGKKVSRSDISVKACAGVSCDEEPLACVAANLSDADAETISALLGVGEQESAFFSKFERATLIPSHLRCLIVNEILPE